VTATSIWQRSLRPGEHKNTKFKAGKKGEEIFAIARQPMIVADNPLNIGGTYGD